mmetsp:Transcript_49212/g.67098  ORF Transcript_49212/g.67098 Transcript_49212/m.67098 type:complete len:373 (-) Transcript_49212:188-1306(-)|eukprot:CAMPEP_0185765198 /NCGR_PEP_ID=MMETSP1174-20130828/27123_1 /TAXON_ID=35687 /ORGANISM="Dictyocha speculum, Strain CCMP1381" /LENGTH=372 /DNA_ID=CAMNT_0028448173 /DNA_START=33 /DNA_END=1151 /DNA_ORIENTATION=+
MAAMEDKKKWESDGAALEDSNVANIGSAEDKAARKGAADLEPAWQGCGLEVGVEIWRIEKFQVVAWPKEEYGSFYAGDSYIILKTTQEEEKLIHDIHFWLGESTSQDEMGTAAYKTVELDDFFDGEPIQHREVMKHESHAFHEIFPKLTYCEGGVDSGFTHVEPEAYLARLQMVKKIGRQIQVHQVPLTRASLNQGDCFILDAGLEVFTWMGSESSPFEKQKCNNVAENIEGSRNRCTCENKNDCPEDDMFWTLLGGFGEISPASEATVSEEIGEGILMRLQEVDDQLIMNEVARGDLKLDQLSSDDVNVVDAGKEIFIWIGNGASGLERRQAMGTAIKYLGANDKPMHTPIHCFKEGASIKNKQWNKIFSD